MDDKKVYSRVGLPDQRIARPVVYLPEGGKTVYQTQKVSQFLIKEKTGISFFTPNGISIFYSKAVKEYNIAASNYNEIIKPYLKVDFIYNVPPENVPKLYDYFESIQSCIIMVYSAIEALCNVAIPEDFTLTKKGNKGITEIWNKTNIEKWMSTEEKAGKIVPEVLKIAGPKNLPFWAGFKQLKEIRDQIIHQKQSLTEPDQTETSFYGTLMEESIFEKIRAGFDLVHFYCEVDQTHPYFPMLQKETPVQVNFVTDTSAIPGLGNGEVTSLI